MLTYIIAGIALFVLVFTIVVLYNRSVDRSHRSLGEVSRAIVMASDKPLEEAIEILKSVGISYQGGDSRHQRFILPKCFWLFIGDVDLRAKTLITLITYEEKNAHGCCESVRVLAKLLEKMSKKYPACVLLITAEFGRQANGEVYKGLCNKLSDLI